MSTQFSNFHNCLVLLVALLAVLVGASIGVHANTNGNIPPPVPVNISSADLDSTLNSVKNSLFFLSPSLSSKVYVEFDNFLLPNGAYTNTTFTWKSLMSSTGANILRKPTAKEVEENNSFGGRPAIYYSGKTHPVYATGTVSMHIPISFTHVKFSANETNTSHMEGPLNVTLQSCSGNTASLLIKGKIEVNDITIILRDSNGRQLAIDESSGGRSDNEQSLGYKVKGAIANIELFIPAAYISRTFDVLACTPPDISSSAESISVKSSRYIPGGAAVAEASYDLASLKAQTSVVAQRDYAMFEFNTPMVVVKLPHTLNSAYAVVNFGEPNIINAFGNTITKLDFGKPNIIDANGKSLTYSPEEGRFNLYSFTNEFRFSEVKGTIAFADGVVHLFFPAKIRLVTLTPAKPSDGAIEARFHGGLVRVNVGGFMADFTLPENLTSVRAFDASGRQLKKLDYNGATTLNRVHWQGYGFWGNIAKLQVMVVDEWLTLNLPFHLPPTPEIPKDQMGTVPSNYGNILAPTLGRKYK